MNYAPPRANIATGVNSWMRCHATLTMYSRCSHSNITGKQIKTYLGTAGTPIPNLSSTPGAQSGYLVPKKNLAKTKKKTLTMHKLSRVYGALAFANDAANLGPASRRWCAVLALAKDVVVTAFG